ncbi:MAG: hypothetical protein JRD89_00230 [Deltaproteobacteria bacterium]|nr:hypothetical protein [Deltaproteobacteria bacterium]
MPKKKTLKEKLKNLLENRSVACVEENGRLYFRVESEDGDFVVFVEQDEYTAEQWVIRVFPLFSVKLDTWDEAEFLHDMLQWTSVLLLSPIIHPIEGGMAIGFQRVLGDTDLWAQVEGFIIDVAVARSKLMKHAIEWDFSVR